MNTYPCEKQQKYNRPEKQSVDDATDGEEEINLVQDTDMDGRASITITYLTKTDCSHHLLQY